MKTNLFKLLAVIAVIAITDSTSVFAQKKPMKVESKAESVAKKEVDDLKRPTNSKTPKPEPKSRGDVYGPDYSDIIVDNFTGYYIDIYVDNEYRGTLSPWDKKTTWAVPGRTKLYAKAVFDDGSYKYWGPSMVNAGYEYTWSLNP
ncbi:MAG: hypothetical protein JSU09_00180 [Bacteroidetes bacterium]|nr:hypothetical protein [Bacteroidota bacterium]